MQIPRPIKIIGNGLLFFFALVGGVVSLAQFPSFWEPTDARTIIAQTEDDILVAQSVFGEAIEFYGRTMGDEQVVETKITLWRDGGAPIEAEMVRRPLEFRMPAGSRVASAVITDVESSVPENFTLEHTNNSVLLRWQVFDPDMAVKISIARLGSVDPVVHQGSLGPGVEVTENRYNTAKTIYYWGVQAFGFLVFLALIGGTRYENFKGVLSAIEKRMDRFPKIIQGIVAVVFLLAIIALFIGGTIGTTRLIPWLHSLVVPPIPFT